MTKNELGCLPVVENSTEETHAKAAQNAYVVAENAYEKSAVVFIDDVHEIKRTQRGMA